MTSTPNTQTTSIAGDLSGAYPDGMTLSNTVVSLAFATASKLKSGTTAADTLLFQVYDVDGAAYVTWLTMTSNNTPDVTIATPTGGTLSIDDATGAEIKRACDVSARMVTLATSTSITVALHEGKTCLLTGAGSAYTQTLPAATGSGAIFKFVVGAVNTSNHIIATDATATFYGQIVTCSETDSPDLAQPWTSAGTNTKITLNGTTTGGEQIGDVITVQDIATNKYLVTGFTRTSGTEATPFGT